MVSRLFAVAVVFSVGGCGGSSASDSGRASSMRMSSPMDMDPNADIAALPPEPVTVAVRGTRLGNSVRLDITGTGGRRPAGHPLERAENWSVEAMAGETRLERMVNGSVKVERYQVGNPALGLWDIEVRFSVAFAVPEDAEQIVVKVSGPESVMHEEVLVIGLAPTAKPTDTDAKPAAEPATKSQTKSRKKSRKKSGK